MVFSVPVRRATKVMRVLVRNGLGWVVDQYGLHVHLPFRHKVYMKKGSKEDLPKKLRISLEELGGAYVKLGQMLSLREDLIPHEYCREFRKLLDQVRPCAFATVKKVIEKELDRPLNMAFKSFEKKPIGSASVAQVHRAVLKNGKKVVVKVQRPNLHKVFQEDLSILRYLARKIEPHLKNSVSAMQIIDEFERFTKQELNFGFEANNIERFYTGFENNDHVRIPRVYWDYCTDKVLTMEYLEGVKLSQTSVKKGTVLAKRLIDSVVYQIFELGVFHADLHPGNIILLPKNVVGIIDFGIVGTLSADIKDKGIRLWSSLAANDLDEIVRNLEDIGFPPDSFNVDAFRKAVFDATRDWRSPLGRKKRISHALRLLFNVSMEYGIKMPPDIILLAKAFLTVEGTSLVLDPDFDFYAYSKQTTEQLMSKRFDPDNVAKTLYERTKNLTEVIYRLPTETLELLDHVKRGRFKIDIEDTDIKHLALDIDKSSNRLSFALIISALAITGALTTSVGPMVGSLSAISLVFFGLSTCFVIPFFVSIHREGRTKYGSA
jgi:ubiquinone biosynthesis protein